MEFVAIDFETANNRRSSACSLGLVRVSDGIIVDRKAWLFSPRPSSFSPFHVALHGINEEKVAGAPTFGEAWDEIKHYIDDNLIVAHSAPFDISVLRNTLEYFNLPTPNVDIICTYRLAQSAYPGAGAYRLDIIASLLDIELTHHDALSDAEASAHILLALCQNQNITSIKGMMDHYGIYPGCLTEKGYSVPCRLNKPSIARSRKSINDVQACYIDDDFCGRNFAFTGALISMPRSKAMEIVKTGSGTPQNSVNKHTDYVVVGIHDITKLGGHSISSKMRKALDMQSNGHKVKIIDESEFIRMIDDELYRICFNDEMVSS